MIYDKQYIESRIVITKQGCWEWQAARDRYGYGLVSRRSSGESLAHRLTWRIYNGSAEHLCVLHKCDNPPCCNPEHLFLGWQAENIWDAMSKGRKYIQPSRITLEVASDIAARLQRGEKQRDIAKLHNISESHLSNLKHQILKEHANG
jgi:hypothetical protein